MEFLDEDARPRFVLQSNPVPSSTSSSSSISSVCSLRKGTLFLCIPLSLLFLALSLSLFSYDPLQSLLIWLSLSLLLGPFAPPSLTAGDISVGRGPPINPPRPIDPDSDSNTSRKFSKRSRSAPKTLENGFQPTKDNGRTEEGAGSREVKEKSVEEEGSWSDGDSEMLKKLMLKHPVGKPGRWEAIAQGFKGRYKVETVIRKSKDLGVKKVSDQDSFKKFLKDRKPVDRPIENENGEDANGETGLLWTAGEDLALLNALKTFPKDVPMRWEKIAVAVPGKSKAACVKRVALLKKDFRSSKAGPAQP